MEKLLLLCHLFKRVLGLFAPELVQAEAYANYKKFNFEIRKNKISADWVVYQEQKSPTLVFY